ncbi:hypothetical protein ACHAPE_002472 [Trichoderma viride]
MDSSMELVPPAPQSPPQQLLSPCQSPKPIDGNSEKLPSHDNLADDLKPHNDCIPTSDDQHDLIPLLYVHDILSKEPSVEPSLFTEDSQDIMDDVQMEENSIGEAKNHDEQDSHAKMDNRIVEEGYAMEGDLVMEEEEQRVPQSFESEADIEDDTLPSVENITAEVLDNLQSQESEESEDDDVDVAEEDEGSEYDDENSISSTDEREHEAPEQNRDSATEKKSNKPRRKRALTAREYVARFYQKEDQKLARSSATKRSRKRKQVGSGTGSSKALKTASGNSFVISDGCTSSFNDDTLPPVQPIKAKTHADQMYQVIANIPENCDNRRSSTQKKDLEEAKKIFGYKRVEADDGKWKIKGMQTSIHHHQLTAVAWMVKRELARTNPYGGILADAMVMGKTVMSLACIIGNPADDEHIAKYCKTTLVIVPSKDIAIQWEEEAQKHWSEPHNHMTFVYDGRRNSVEQWCKRKLIVIATYSQLTKEYPDKVALKKLAEKYGTDSISYHRERDKIVGPLFRINWYRIILDEAHAIKNAESETSKICCELFGKYRWALSGTPLANSSQEMYPYMRFLQCDWTATRRKFLKTFFFGDKPNAEFDALTSLIMYRRTINDDFLGRKMISLPKRKVIDLWVPMSDEEHCILGAVTKHYEEMKLRCELGKLGFGDLKDIQNVEDADNAEDQGSDTDCRQNSATKEGSKRRPEHLLQRASQVRQRQSTSHAFCIERLLRENFRMEQLVELQSELKEIGHKQTILDQMQRGMKSDDEISKYKIGLEMLQERKETFLGCLVPTLHQAIGAGKQIDCPHEGCTKKLKEAERMNVRSLQKIIQEAEKKDSGYCDPAKDSCNVSVQQGNDRSGFFIASTFRNDFPILPSTKLTAAMAVVLTWMHEAPADKILIFTQFRGTAKMLGYMLRTLQIGFVYYMGGLTSIQKRRALDAIKTNDDIKVMVATLKSGGQSLNLTAANRVIIIDPWWNKTAEQQAFGRVVRIGQEKSTHLVNIKTEGPVDHRIYTLQEKKAKDVDRTLQDNGHTSRPVSEVELQKVLSREEE